MTTTDTSRELAKNKLAGILSNTTSIEYQRAVIYIVYRTIESNRRITLNRLKHLLLGDLLFSSQLVDGAVAVLSSKSIFASVSMFQIKSSGVPNFHLDIKPTEEFIRWLSVTEFLLPELVHYTPPIYIHRKADNV